MIYASVFLLHISDLKKLLLKRVIAMPSKKAQRRSPGYMHGFQTRSHMAKLERNRKAAHIAQIERVHSFEKGMSSLYRDSAEFFMRSNASPIQKRRRILECFAGMESQRARRKQANDHIMESMLHR